MSLEGDGGVGGKSKKRNKDKKRQGPRKNGKERHTLFHVKREYS